MLIVVGFLAGVLADALSASAATDDSSANSSAVQTASYSVGKSGARLKWLGHQAEPVKSKAEPAKTDSEVTPTQYAEPSCEVQAAQSLQPSTRTWSKSLGEKNVSPAPAEKMGDSLPPITPGKKSTNGPSQLDQELTPQRITLKDDCPSSKDFKHISDLNTNIAPSEGDLPHDCPLGQDVVFQPRSFSPITYTWTASALCHKPLYFEDVQLERYGHMAGPWLQPFASGANFFLTIPILPYKMGLEPPNECLYTLGYYRTGSCAPYLFDPLPLSVRGMFFESVAWVGAAAMF